MASEKKPKRKEDSYPPPLCFDALTDHKYTFVILHGRGSTAEKFAPPLMAMAIPMSLVDTGKHRHLREQKRSDSFEEESTLTLHQVFPDARFVFPTASLRRATIYGRCYTHQWFDNWHLDQSEYREELQIEGLKASSNYLRHLVRLEAKEIGMNNIVIWGLSQGCATSLITGLVMSREQCEEDGKLMSVGAAVGMCGYLPYRARMEEFLGLYDVQKEEGDLEDPFIDSSSSNTNQGIQGSSPEPAQEAIAWLQDELELSRNDDLTQNVSRMSFWDVALFLGHGTEDKKVPIRLGREAVDCMRALGREVEWREYEGLGHWYSPEMLSDIVAFLRQHLR